MARSRAFRPGDCERLEPRLVLSRSVGLVGALGDSYTDEYQFSPPYQSHARNWVEILNGTGKASFGPFTTTGRGEPRDAGFATNWARSGATSDLMVQAELPGLAQQVRTGRINYAWIFVGADDFLRYLQAAAQSPPTPAVAAQQLGQVEANAQHNLDVAVTTLLAASPRTKLVVATVPSLALLPIVKSLATTPEARALVAGADRALTAYNAHIHVVGSISPRVAVADLAGQLNPLGAAGPTIGFGGTTIALDTASDDYRSFFVGDGLHVGTVAQGLIADAFLSAVHFKFGAQVPGLTAKQIVNLAALVQYRTRYLP